MVLRCLALEGFFAVRRLALLWYLEFLKDIIHLLRRRTRSSGPINSVRVCCLARKRRSVCTHLIVALRFLHKALVRSSIASPIPTGKLACPSSALGKTTTTFDQKRWCYKLMIEYRDAAPSQQLGNRRKNIHRSWTFHCTHLRQMANSSDFVSCATSMQTIPMTRSSVANVLSFASFSQPTRTISMKILVSPVLLFLGEIFRSMSRGMD